MPCGVGFKSINWTMTAVIWSYRESGGVKTNA
jgi:hypothetical protein